MPEPSDASDGLGGMAGSTSCGAESGGHRKQRHSRPRGCLAASQGRLPWAQACGELLTALYYLEAGGKLMRWKAPLQHEEPRQ